MLLIEDKEIKTWEKHIQTTTECAIKGDVFSSLCKEETTFHSDIFRYDDLCVVANRESRFGEVYFNIAVYNEEQEKAWPLLTLPASLDINVRRFDSDRFIVWTDTKDQLNKDMRQCSFCCIKDSEKIENITIDFNFLKGIHVLPKNHVLLAASQKLGGQAGIDEKEVNTLTLYDMTGRMVKIFYEWFKGDPTVYDYTFDADKNELCVNRSKNGNVPQRSKVNIIEIIKDS